MKSKFISILFEVLNEISNLTEGFLIKESMEYKMMRAGGLNPRKIYQGFNNLKHRQIIKPEVRGLVLTSKGRQWFLDLKFKRLRIQPVKKRWDKKWRIVIFDIPEQFRWARRVLHSKLKFLGFFMIQKSVFVYPFPCEREITFLGQYLEITPYVEVIIAISMGSKEEELKKYFTIR